MLPGGPRRPWCRNSTGLHEQGQEQDPTVSRTPSPTPDATGLLEPQPSSPLSSAFLSCLPLQAPVKRQRNLDAKAL